MRATWIGLTLLLGGLAMSASGRAEESADARLEARFKKYLDEEFRQRPLEATRLGDHRFDDRLDDLSPKARAAWTERYRSTLADLDKGIDRTKLSRGGQIDLDIFRHHLTY